jgi:hypothetical protein
MTGYPTKNLWFCICRTDTKMPDAEYEHQTILAMLRTYPMSESRLSAILKKDVKTRGRRQ